MVHKNLYDNVEFYFGKGVGSKIYDALNQACQSIFILTPYVSQGYIDFLLRKKQEGISVSLITTSDADRGNVDEICRKIIFQHRTTNEEKLTFKNKAKKRCLLFGLVTLIFEFLILFWNGYHSNSHTFFQMIKNLWRNDAFILLLGMIVLCILFLLYKKFHRIKIFDYFYNTRFPFLLIPSFYSNHIRGMSPSMDPFVHAKIYIVDDKDIFIGSANFTSRGLRQNIESFVKISKPDSAKLIKEIHAHIKAHCSPINIHHLGSRLYPEPAY